MAVRLASAYYSEKGAPCIVYIYDSHHVGATTSFDTDNIRVSWKADDADERFAPVIASEMRLGLYIKTAGLQTFVDDLVGADEGRFTISFAVLDGLTPTFTWSGYILPDLVSIEDAPLVLGYLFEVRATDGLGRLKSIDYNNAGIAYTGKETFVEHVLNCLNKLDFVTDLFPAPSNILKIVSNWHEDSYTYASTINPMHRSRVSHGAFYYRDTKGNTVYSSCYDVLKEICRAWGCRIMLSGDAFWIVQVNEYASPAALTVFNYQTDGTESVSASQDLSIVHNQVDLSASKLLRFSGGLFQFYPALQYVQADYKHIASRNLLAGYVWTDVSGDMVSVPDIDDNSNTARVSFSGKLTVNSQFFPDAEGVPFQPYRLRFRVTISIAGYNYSRIGTIGGGYLGYSDDAWEADTPPQSFWYDVYSPLLSSESEYYTVNLSILTLPLPDTGTLNFDFEFHKAYFEDGSEVGTGSTVQPIFQLTDTYLEYLGDGTFESQSDVYRYKAVNNATASKKLELISAIGDGPNLVSPGHIEVKNDADEWVISDAWRVGNSGTYKAFSQLLCNEIIKGQLSPVKRLVSFSFQNLDSPATPLVPHKAISYDSAYWVFNDGSFDFKTDIFTGNWYKIQAGSTYTESAVAFIPKDSSSGPPTTGSSGGTGTTGGSGGTGTGGGTGTPGSIVTMYRQEFLNQSGDTVTITANGGTLPAANQDVQVMVFMNGQKLWPSQYTITGSNIQIDADTHYAGANYEVIFTIIQ